MAPRGFGATGPIADTRTAAGRAQTRRVEFIISGK
jgi:outer membrane protein OmpA-like peptidoglycan-associated protein